MMENLEIADAIDSNTTDSAYDEYCKKVLSNKQVLAHILKTCVREYADVPLKEIPSYIEHDPMLNVSMEDSEVIKGRNVEDQSVFGAEIRYDILFDAKLPHSSKEERIGLFINIEAQNHRQTAYPLITRAIYYCSRLLARQKNHEGGFGKSNFQQLKKVYSIWIVMNATKEMEGMMNFYTIEEKCLGVKYHLKKESYDKLEIIMLYPKSYYELEDEPHSLMEMLYILFKAKLTSEIKKYQLMKNYGILMMKEEVDVMCNLSQGWFDDGRADGLADGRIMGIAETVSKLMKINNMKIENVMDMLEIAENIRPAVVEAIQTTQTKEMNVS